MENGTAKRSSDPDANQDGHGPRWRQDHPHAKLVMRVHKVDLIQSRNTTARARSWSFIDSSGGRDDFKLAPHNETGNLDRRHATDNEIDPFRWLMAPYGTLKSMGAVPVRVDELGRAWRIRTEALTKHSTNCCSRHGLAQPSDLRVHRRKRRRRRWSDELSRSRRTDGISPLIVGF